MVLSTALLLSSAVSAEVAVPAFPAVPPELLPPFPPTMSQQERRIAHASEILLYTLMFVQPLIGWGMLSAAAYPVVLFGGVQLPAILPQSDSLHALLWNAHFYLAFAFFALILLHVAAALFHALVRRDGVFEAMASVSTTDAVAPAE